jgi:capsular polysaccharide biosynthesis protein
MRESERIELLRAVARRLRISVLIVVLAAAAGFGYGKLSPSTYTAQTFLVAVPQVSGDTVAATAFATAYSRLATQPVVLAEASAASGIAPDTLRAAVSAATSPDAPVISITGSAHDPAAAAADANAVADALASIAAEHVADTSVKLTVLAEATAPTHPSSASATLDAALGAAAGVLLASLAALAGGGATGRWPEEPGARWPEEPGARRPEEPGAQTTGLETGAPAPRVESPLPPALANHSASLSDRSAP